MLKPIRRAELARIRQEEVLFSAPEADVDEDVSLADLGRLKHLEAEPLLALFVGLRARDRVPVVQELAVLLEQFQGGLEQVVLSRDGPRERRGEVSHRGPAPTPTPASLLGDVKIVAETSF